ncbi:MAG: hypothetical protein ACR2QC_01885 [Gammaproteobacteria bacterium]
MLKKYIALFFLCLVVTAGVAWLLVMEFVSPRNTMAQPSLPPIAIEEIDGSPSVLPMIKLLVTNGQLVNDGGGQATLTVGTGVPASDSVEVNGAAVDTTADFTDGVIEWTLTDGGAGGPDAITAAPATASITATHLAGNSVGSEEFNATDSRGDIESVARLNQLQGAVTDAQVPNDITINTTSALTGTTATFTGTISGEVGVTLDTAATVDLSTAANARGGMRINADSGVIDYTLPPAEAGLNICFYSQFASIVTVDPDDTADTITLDGTALAAGNAIDSPGTAGDFICLLAIDATNWLTLGRSGTWVDGGAD